MKGFASIHRTLGVALLVGAAIVSQVAEAQVIGSIDNLPPGVSPVPGGASRDPRGPGPGRRPGHRPPRGDNGHGPGAPGGDIVSVFVNQSYFGFASLDVSAILSHQSQGREIEALTVRMVSNSGRGQATILVNGAPADRTQYLQRYSMDYSFNAQGGGGYSGYNNRVELRMTGDVYVEAITARLAPMRQPWPQPDPSWPPHGPPSGPQYPGGNIVSKYMNQHFAGDAVLDVGLDLDLHQHYGRRVQRVILRASARQGWAQATLLINGWAESAPMSISGFSQDISFYPTRSRELGREIGPLQIQLQGRGVTVESVSVELY